MINMIKPKYYDRETAPLIYYKIICGVLTVGVVLGVLSLIFNIIALFNGGVWQIVLAEKLVFLVIAILVLDGLKNWKWRGVRWLGVYFLLYLIDSLTVKYLEGTFDIYTCSVLIVAWLLWFIPTAVYFKKRRALFAPPVIAIPQAQYAQQNAQMKQYIVDESTGEIISESPVTAVQEETAPQLEHINEQPKSSDPLQNESTEENRQEQTKNNETTQAQDKAEQVKRKPAYKKACIALLLLLIGVSAFGAWNILSLQQQVNELNDALAEVTDDNTYLQMFQAFYKRAEEVLSIIDDTFDELAVDLTLYTTFDGAEEYRNSKKENIERYLQLTEKAYAECKDSEWFLDSDVALMTEIRRLSKIALQDIENIGGDNADAYINVVPLNAIRDSIDALEARFSAQDAFWRCYQSAEDVNSKPRAIDIMPRVSEPMT